MEEPIDQGEVIEQAEPTDVGQEDAATSTGETQPEAQDERNGVQKRIDELTAKNYREIEARQQAEETARQAQERLQELQAKQAQGQWQQTQPRLEDYDYDTDRWSQAYQNWVNDGVKREKDEAEERAKQQTQQQEQVRRAVDLQRKMTEAQSKYSDFNVKINDPNLPSIAEINPAAYEAIVDSDATGDIAYYLANNPSEVYQFRDMSPIRAIKEVAKIEAKLSSSANITTAPPPPSNSGMRADVTPGEPTDINEWMKWRYQNMGN